ncbi:MAG: homogentisate 1,2-dioxygenase [Armatimonadetes bacterium]|nr:homogentisate 1,2-dioxygenase [Armatimonadota bacterium]
MRYHHLGELPRKHHIAFRKADGSLYAEQLFSTIGFSGPMSTMYHINLPTEVSSFEDRGAIKRDYIEEEPLRHRHFKTAKMKPHGDAVNGRVLLMGNHECEWNQVYVAEQMKTFFKNTDGDEILFIHDGKGELQSMFGTVKFREGDYLVIPRGTIYKLQFETLPVRMLAIVSYGPVSIPRRYRNEYGQLLEHAPYKERDFRAPSELVTIDERKPHEVLIRSRHRLTSYIHPYHPFDIVGWDGYVFPYAFNINDFQPITGAIHMPPPIHQTFDGNGFVICSFCPRMLDYYPDAIKIPYNHSNIDSDEVLYYCNDKFGSRKGIEEGSITMHPLGIPHGPQPGAVEASMPHTRTEELAVMLDTFHALKIAKNALSIEDPDYWKSWQAKS